MKQAPYNPIDVANYIVWRANELGKPVTHLKLQKLLYYVVAKYLKQTNRPLISESVSKWQFGPVVKSVYHQFKLYGQSLITEPSAYLISNDIFNLEFVKTDVENATLDKDQVFRQSVTFVLNKLLNCSPFELVDRTHQEPAWKDFELEILRAKEDLYYTDDELRVANI